ncbi:MAG: right-handed parallel beta-helix repeat-containing protein [Candidatus Eisenbacteria bacterium]|nr:right-handed parallel beta-helix repeat-containing protein [Candidatus Eisenbacteria bacterium]
MSRIVILMAVALAAAAAPAPGHTYRVAADGSGDFMTIQEGLSAALGGDTVSVAPGTYSGAGNRSLNFGGRRVLLIAPAGPESTTIDCESAARGFTFSSGEDTTAVVRGFTITRGYAAQGGGINCTGASPLIDGCWFVANSATSGAGAFFASSSAKVRNCVFTGNTATYGSGATFLLSAVVVRNCTFARNGGAGAPGTLYCVGSPAPTFRACVVAFSAAGPPMKCENGASPVTTRSVVFGNAGGNTLCGNATDNLVTDPLLCGMLAADYTLCANSPCLPGNNAWGERVGALGAGCGDCASAVEPMSWGRIKALWR